MIPSSQVVRAAKIEQEDGPLDSADRALGAAVYLGKRQGFGAALGFRLSAIFYILGRILTFQVPGTISSV